MGFDGVSCKMLYFLAQGRHTPCEGEWGLGGLKGAPTIPLHPWQAHLQQPSSSGAPAGLRAMHSGHTAPDAGGGHAASATLHG